MHIKTITVIGADGTLGHKVSGIFASFGNAKVYMAGRNIEKVKRAVKSASESVKADSIEKRLIPIDYSGLGKAITESNLVFESVAENQEIKFEINRKIACYADKNTILCTGTSGISINSLAESLPEHLRKNYMGMHLFNPPYNMILCEMIPSKYTDRNVFQSIQEYASTVLLRKVIEVKDSPAFLGNRIGFQFINEALICAEAYKHKGGIDYIDSILGPFTGRSMAPLITSDFVGLDTHRSIVDTIYANTDDYAHNSFVLPGYVHTLVKNGSLGRKTSQGLYKTEKDTNGNKRYLVFDILEEKYRDTQRYTFQFAENMIEHIIIGDYINAFKILVKSEEPEAVLCLEFLLNYIVYALLLSEQIGYTVHAADDAMAAGFNWCPPLALIEVLSGRENVLSLAKERLPCEVINNTDIEKLFSGIEKSHYDYRPFIMAKRQQAR